MILDLDTFALFNLYVEEPGSEQVRSATAAAQARATHELSYVEARSAFGRKRREGGWSDNVYRQVLQALEDDWPALHRVAVTTALIRRAAECTERFALRAYDAVQLAASEAVKNQVGATAQVRFCCFDERLSAAAEQIDIQ